MMADMKERTFALRDLWSVVTKILDTRVVVGRWYGIGVDACLRVERRGKHEMIYHETCIGLGFAQVVAPTPGLVSSSVEFSLGTLGRRPDPPS